jgi:Ca2+-binding RTX toxin-like protein
MAVIQDPSGTGAVINVDEDFDGVFGFDGDDTINVSDNAQGGIVDGGSGNDTINDGSAGNVLAGVSGSDSISAGGGFGAPKMRNSTRFYCLSIVYCI